MPGLGDEFEILVGELEDRDALEVHLLLAGEREQQVEGALEAFEIDDQALLRRPLGKRVFAHEIVGHRRLIEFR